MEMFGLEGEGEGEPTPTPYRGIDWNSLTNAEERGRRRSDARAVQQEPDPRADRPDPRADRLRSHPHWPGASFLSVTIDEQLDTLIRRIDETETVDDE